MLHLQSYRLRKGLSPGEVAERTGLSHNAINNLESPGENALRSLTFDQLTVVGAVYGIELTDILDWLRGEPRGARNRAEPADAAKIEAALADADEPMDRECFAVAFGWTLERSQAALDAVAERMRGSGQALMQVAGDRYRLIARPEVLSRDDQQQLQVQRRRTDHNLSRAEATVLRVVLDQPNQTCAHAMFTDPKERDAVAELLRAGRLLEFDDSLHVHEDVVFSLFHRYRPPHGVLAAASKGLVPGT